MGEMVGRCEECIKRSGGKNSRSASDADWGISGRGRETRGLWHRGEAPMPLSDDMAAASIRRRWATLVRLTLFFADLRGLPREICPRAGSGGGGDRGSSISMRSTAGVRHGERVPVLSSPSLSVSTRGLWYFRYPCAREVGGDAGEERALDELRLLSGTSRSRSRSRSSRGADTVGRTWGSYGPLFRSAYISSLVSRAKLSIGPKAFRRGDGISDCGDESVQGSGDCDRGGRSGCRVGLGGVPIVGVDMDEVPG
ncbi:hypothetical protein BD311DRAFT_754801 [Dichomitus squalens]|uniref:Uncharacterized protein n=1 Tax=Dichomitus squalens TaxID=114155 RepID=A0A4Q9MRJ3_9APHY|nr:hypothetical protein BD311DRAFT_754801 [Dichomitus squalens]